MFTEIFHVWQTCVFANAHEVLSDIHNILHRQPYFFFQFYCDTLENSGISCNISYICSIGQCDLINMFWVTTSMVYPGGSMCRICHLTSKQFIFTLIGSY